MTALIVAVAVLVGLAVSALVKAGRDVDRIIADELGGDL